MLWLMSNFLPDTFHLPELYDRMHFYKRRADKSVTFLNSFLTPYFWVLIFVFWVQETSFHGCRFQKNQLAYGSYGFLLISFFFLKVRNFIFPQSFCRAAKRPFFSVSFFYTFRFQTKQTSTYLSFYPIFSSYHFSTTAFFVIFC